jgi:uncharacterized membrane protein
MRHDVVIAIFAMAVATYATRFSGLMIGRFMPHEGRMKQALDALPPAILTAVIAPAVLAGPETMIAGGVTLLMALRFSLIISMPVGVLAIILCRNVFGL